MRTVVEQRINITRFQVFNLSKGQDITPTNDNQPETYPTIWIKYDEITMDLEGYDIELIEG